jgi:hypothetical protein
MYNQVIKLLAVVTLFCVAAACNNKIRTPEETVKAFAQAMEARDYAKAKTLGTANTTKLVEVVEGLTAGQTQEEIRKQMDSTSKTVAVTCQEKGEGRKTCMCEDDKGNKNLQAIEVVLQDGKWLVDMKKESPSDPKSEGNVHYSRTTTTIDSIRATKPLDHSHDGKAGHKKVK